MTISKRSLLGSRASCLRYRSTSGSAGAGVPGGALEVLVALRSGTASIPSVVVAAPTDNYVRQRAVVALVKGHRPGHPPQCARDNLPQATPRPTGRRLLR